MSVRSGSASVDTAQGPRGAAVSFVATAPRRQPGRLLGVDATRGFAIISMFISHAGVFIYPFLMLTPGVWTIRTQFNNVASPLFALVMGVSAAIVLARVDADGRATRRGVYLLQNAARGVILIVIGLVLVSWNSWIAIVLPHLGVLMILGTSLLLLSTRMLVVAFVAACALGPVINDLVRAAVPPETLAGTDPGSLLLQWLFVGGSYRFTSLVPLFLIGAILYRVGIDRMRVCLATLAAGVACYVGAYIFRRVFDLVDEVQSGSWVDLLNDLGLSLSAVGAICALGLLASRTGGAARVLRVALTPLVALGSLALSAYVLHVGLIVLLARYDQNATQMGDRWISFVTILLGIPALTLLWWRFIGLGPVEWLIGALTGRYVRLRR